MRITSIELSGFRGFAKTQSFDVDADAVVVVGVNGQGKTSLFDAVLWAITGGIPRLGADDRNLVSMYSESGEVRVTLSLRSDNGRSAQIVRSFDGTVQRIRFEADGEAFREDLARLRLAETLWPSALVTSDSAASLTSAITHSVYLQQDLVRQFIEADTDQTRFTAVSELVGAGRVTELQQQLERARAAWTRVTTERTRELEFARQRLVSLESQLASLDSGAGDEVDDLDRVWGDWWAHAQQLGVTSEPIPEPRSVQAGQILDNAIGQLDALQRANSRRYETAAQLFSEISASEGLPPPDEERLKTELDAQNARVGALQTSLAEARDRSARERRAQLELRESRDELRTLAQLALRHIGDDCPVCGQTHNVEATRARLEILISAVEVTDAAPPAGDEVAGLAAELEEAERSLAVAEARLRDVQREGRELQVQMAERAHRLRELEIDPGSGAEGITALEQLVTELGAVTEAINVQRDNGEQLALRLTAVRERARRSEVSQGLAAARREVQEQESVILSRQETWELCGRILEAIREASSDVVATQVERIEPVLKRIYARIDPHPVFRDVRMLSRVSRGRGRIATAVDDLLANLSSELPSIVLSSSQMNALAVAVFLALNLGVPTLPLKAALLDDPLQSLDDVNLLGLIDLLRRVKDRRQLIISTHDPHFGDLLTRKLRPVAEAQRTVAIELDGWGREGPTVTQRDIEPDLRPLRIAV